MSLEDRFAIIEMLGKYSAAWDGKDPDAWSGCFTEDGSFDSRLKGQTEPIGKAIGRAALRKVAAGTFVKSLANVQTRHYQTNTVFLSLTGDEARTQTMIMVVQLRPGEAAGRITSTGTYVDRWERTPEGWRIAERSMYRDSMDGAS